MGYKVEAEVWKVVDGKEVELMHDGVVFRRTDYLLIENKAKEQERNLNIATEQLTMKYEKIMNKGEMLHDTVADAVMEKFHIRIRSNVVKELKEFLSTGWRTKPQIYEWFKISLQKKKLRAEKIAEAYIYYLDSTAKTESMLIDGENAYRLRNGK